MPGVEARTFRPDGMTNDYWIIDKSGHSQARYEEAKVPEWKVEDELELKEAATRPQNSREITRGLMRL